MFYIAQTRGNLSFIFENLILKKYDFGHLLVLSDGFTNYYSYKLRFTVMNSVIFNDENLKAVKMCVKFCTNIDQHFGEYHSRYQYVDFSITFSKLL